ncbi:MAG: ComF family protein [Gammaproteobacteria bacterium]|nr:MAG: ComF family protein [Gammaproteobacteria bacterium]
MKVYNHLIRIREQLFPSVCAVCNRHGQTGVEICKPCGHQLPLNHRACHVCALPLKGNGQLVCGHCLKTPPHFDHTLAPLIYKEPVDKLILDLKFRDKLRHANLLSNLFLDNHKSAERPQLLIPLPLHSSRIRERGYNQALELARVLSNKTGIALDKKSCIRTRSTAPQSSLSMKDRRRNIRNAFSVTSSIQAEHVAIIDDVLTSGHTANELAKVLKKSGVGRVDVWVMARAGTEG